MRISKDPETRRQEIMDAARELFRSQGYDKTSIEDIVKEVNVAKGLFYYYFPKKEAILSAIADQFIDEVNEEFKQDLQQDLPDLASVVHTVLTFFLDTVEKNEKFLNISTSSGTVVSLYVKQRLENTAIDALIGLLTESPEKLRSRYPEYTARILVRGLADLYLDGVTDPKIILTLIEEILGLSENQLTAKASSEA